MIRTPTVFILGAGASAPYGFPTGRGLVERIIKGLEPRERLYNLLTPLPCGFKEKHLEQFRSELRKSRRSSVDTFLEGRSPEFVAIGKATIAIELMPLERDEDLLAAKPGEDWYAYLFDHMMKEHFGRNHLSVITFNFDRSFERALFQTLQAAYSLNDVDCSTLCHKIQLLHFHGDLGEPSWLVDSLGPRQESRDYVCEPHIPDRDSIKWCADRIRLGSEGAVEATMEDAHLLLDSAKRVCFIGFGYDPLALERLNIAELTRGKVVRGTALGRSHGERGPIEAAFDKIHLYDMNAYDFLRQTDVVHE